MQNQYDNIPTSTTQKFQIKFNAGFGILVYVTCECICANSGLRPKRNRHGHSNTAILEKIRTWHGGDKTIN